MGGDSDDEDDTSRLRSELESARSSKELVAALSDARRVGALQLPEFGRARDRLLQLELGDRKTQTEQIIKEAVKADDYWKMQAAMAMAVSTGQSAEVEQLKELMCEHGKRQEAVRAMKVAFKMRDTAQLRTAIEKALMIRCTEATVKQGRDDLRKLETWTNTKQQLRDVMTSPNKVALKDACEAAERAEFDAADSTAAELQRTVRLEWQTLVLEDLETSSQAKDLDGIGAGMLEARNAGIDEADLAKFKKRCLVLAQQGDHRQKLRGAVAVGDKAGLLAAVKNASDAGLSQMDLAEANEALRTIAAHEAEAVRLAREREQRDAEMAHRANISRQLVTALEADDLPALQRATAVAEEVGISGSEIALAKERIRHTLSSQGAAGTLQAAVMSGEVYKLRAAIASARGSGVSEVEISRARDALRLMEKQAQARRDLEAACATHDAERLQEALSTAKEVQLPRSEIAAAQTELNSILHSDIGGQLRHAMEVGDLEALRSAATTAGHAGVSRHEVDAAWKRINDLEASSWQSRELQSALGSRDPARLQAAIKLAEDAVSQAEIDKAREKLKLWSAQRSAKTDLQFARAGMNVINLRAALEAACAVGLDESDEVVAARADLQSLEGGAGASDDKRRVSFKSSSI